MNNNPKWLMVESDKLLTSVITEKAKARQIECKAINEISNNFIDEVISFLPDIISMSMLFPGVNGLKLTKLIKSNPKTSQIPVFFLTNFSDEKTIKEAKALGVIDYLIPAQHSISEMIDFVLSKVGGGGK